MEAASDIKVLVLAVFFAVYLTLVFVKERRALVAWTGLLALVLFTPLHFIDGLSFINWNVLGIFVGSLIVADFFSFSGVPALLAETFVEKSRTVGGAILWVCVLSSLLSSFVENVATVLVIAPIAFEISRRLKISPVPFLIGIAISSNLQGTATLIGDPPSMILAGHMKMTFNDFFFMMGKPGIFFAVQAGAACSFLVLYLLFRKYRQAVTEIPKEKIKTWFPTYLLIGMIVALSLSSYFDTEFSYLAGIICVIAGVIALVALSLTDRSRAKVVLKEFDLDTTLFLAGIFVLVGFMEEVGVLEDIAQLFAGGGKAGLFLVFTVLVWFSVLISAFICNIPYITAMLPVVHKLAIVLDVSPYPLVFGLLIGACLGGNISPIGASANIVAVGLARKDGYSISFLDFAKIGLPFTVAATLAGYIFLWIVWV
jgi:Na+/H+ antiporter NhaD/arsenite permease-like protein